uniref:Uncharacterized protein n=1 Tax=Alexandrium catenella TaxID=2925 RepID=A0A7S1RUT6_ALECA|mmetsp:Transcript_7398/g.19995  ORF Transcript_7398/g.19995 Transcript_7398/m.19995 type:complete len:301 (+) Transcript_7398:58-960(+)
MPACIAMAQQRDGPMYVHLVNPLAFASTPSTSAESLSVQGDPYSFVTHCPPGLEITETPERSAVYATNEVKGSCAMDQAMESHPLGRARGASHGQELVSSVLQNVLGDDFIGLDDSDSCKGSWEQTVWHSDSLPDGTEHRWWTKSTRPLLCPLTGFPINLLPYPPFKLRADPQKPSPYTLVDGKFLAMLLVVDHQTLVGGRRLQASDLRVLDSYVRRCKLGPFKPARLQELQLAVANAASAEARTAALQELSRFRNEARAELGKLRKIQETRVLHVLRGEAGGRRHGRARPQKNQRAAIA